MADSRLQRELKQTRPFRSPTQEAKVAVLKTADVIKRRLTAVVGEWGLTFQQYNVLRILRGSDPAPLPTLEIGERMIESTPGITRLLDRLEQKGLVRRERGREDRRMVHCWITPAGIELLAQLDKPMADADQSSMVGLAEDEIRRLIELLERVRSNP